ncbi:MAG: Fe-S cluster assembly protein SufD [Anaerolineae bacterium]|nr:Fe-S cluster assembly protein SufD [Anaerolineae bacterium]
MMAEAQVIVRGSRRRDVAAVDFTFSADAVRLGENEYIRQYRLRAWEDYQRLKIPAASEEAWRRTDLRGVHFDLFQLPQKRTEGVVPAIPEAYLNFGSPGESAGQVILYPGGSRQSLQEDLLQKGIVFADLLTAERDYPHIVEKILGRVVRSDESKFSALAGALSQQGALLYVPAGVVVERPFHSLLWGEGGALAYLSHLLVYLEDNASVTYIHEAASRAGGDTQSLHAGLVEICVGEGASLQFVELQSWGEDVCNFSHERARIARDGNIHWMLGAVGSGLTKSFMEIELAGEGSSGRMSGFYFADHRQHLDYDTQQNHLAARTTSDLLFKGALLGESRTVWQGMIYVAPGADKADGYQANRNLILSGKARADSIPGLEILADDVRCTHGATVGKIDQNQVFYLLSRGITRKEAERLIVEGFFAQLIERIPQEHIRVRFERFVHEKMRNY